MTGRSLLDRRLCFVLGKGGVGKSTVSASLGLLAARSGKRTLLIEVAGQRSLSPLFGHHDEGDVERPLAPGLVGLSVEPERAMEEYLVGQIKVRAMAEVLVRSRAFYHFATAAPNLSELLTVGKIWRLATALDPSGRPVWDYLVVDCPATGHALALLETAGNVSQIAQGGPIHDQAERIEQVVRHPAATAVVVVARPEELSVSETIESVATLEDRGMPMALAVMNAAGSRRFDHGSAAVLERAAAAPGLDERTSAALASAAGQAAREEDERALVDRLQAAIELPIVELPALVCRRMDLAGLERLADALAEGIQLALREQAAAAQ